MSAEIPQVVYDVIDALPVDPIAKGILKTVARASPGIVEAVVDKDGELAQRRLYEATVREIEHTIASRKLRERQAAERDGEG